MNICMMTNTYAPHIGGVARSIQSFAEQYEKKGHNVLIVAPTFPQDKDHTNKVIRIPALQNFNGSDFSVRIAVPGYIAEAIKDFNPDIIHSHHPFLMGDTAVRTARQYQLPLVFTHHTLYEQYTHYTPFNTPGFKELAKKLATSYANLCSLVIAPSTSLAQIIRERGVKTPIEVVPTGVNQSFFQSGDGFRARQKWGIPQNSFVVGHVGRLAPEKNLHFLSVAVREAIKQRPDIYFMVVGEGSCQEEMSDILLADNISDNVIFTGSLSGVELADAYKAMDIFAFASQSETQGMVIAEAMAAGLPVLALDAPGVRDVVQTGRNGIMLPEDTDTEKFADHVQKLSETENFQEYCACALETASQLSHERCVNKMLDLYEELIETKSQAAGNSKKEYWARILNAFQAEWELFTEKASSVFQLDNSSAKKRS